MSTTVLFVDDDRRFIKLYADAVREVGLEVSSIHGVDDALGYLRDGGAADVVVWDMMMAPGIAFADLDTQGGLLTGKFLYEEMSRLRPDAVFILLTNHGFDFQADRPRLHVRIKADTPPDELAAFISKLLGHEGESAPDVHTQE